MAANGSLSLLEVKSPYRQRKHHHGNKKERKTESKVLGVTEPDPKESETSDEYLPFPKEHQNQQVQESDGNFFESFTALSWKQENKRLRAASEDDKEAEKPPPSEVQFGIKPKIHHLNKKGFELLYIEVLYTIKHKIGVTSGGHSPFIQDLYQYAQEAFRVTPEDHARLLAKATEEKPPIVILNITVLEAAGLEAKDADGFSDPYCMLGIMPGRLLVQEGSPNLSSDDDSPKTKEKRSGIKKFSSSLKKKKERTVRDLVPARLIKTTDVKRSTLDPVWNEKFRLDLENVNTDRIHLDIWDHDDEFSVFDAAKKLNEVQGLKGLGRFFKQVAQSARTSKSSGNVDDFLGCVTIPLSNIPSTGSDCWFPLEGRSSRSNIQGQIRLKMSLATREDRGIPEDDNWTDIRQHEDLMSVFVEHEIRKFQDVSFKWAGDLPKPAQTILHQHSIQGDITPVQQAMCRWIAYSSKHLEHPFDYQLLLTLLKDLDELWKPESLSREEEESLADSFKYFMDYCLSLLRKQREVFPATIKTAVNRLDCMLQCMAQIHGMDVFSHCCPFHKEIHSEVSLVIKKGTLEWYERIYSLSKAQTKTDNEEEVLQSMIELTNALNTDMHRSLLLYDKLFKPVHVQYFHITYRQLEKLLGEEANEDLRRRLNRMEAMGKDITSTPLAAAVGTTLFELYLALQEFCKFKDNIPQSDWKSLTIPQFYEWFRFALQQWLSIARQKALKRIQKAIELDKVAQVNAGIKYSTSAVDVCCCFAQITEFWKQLAWPDLVGAYPLVYKLTEDICKGCVLYADLIHEKLVKAGYYDEEGQFDITEQLCVTINNIEQVRRSLKPLPENLQFGRIQEALEVVNMDAESKTRLMELIKDADDELVKKILQTINRVADKMRPDIKKDVFHLNWAPESVPADDAIGDLLEYLDSNLITLNNNLLKTNFDRILESIWVEVLEEFKEVLETEEMKQPLFYQRMFDAIGLLVDFFYANEKGLSMQKILSEQFKDLRHLLSLHKMDTLSLIETFFENKVQQQKELESTEYGILNVRVWYRGDTQTLLVEVLNAKNIIPLDANGLSDPFVMLQFCPELVFPNIAMQSTRIVKKTLNPDFDETFEYMVTSQQLKRKGATLVFTVMDHDYVFQNDFAGEAYMDLAEVPGAKGEMISGWDALNIISLKLMHPKPKESSALEILSARVWDAAAQDFVKKRNKIEEQAS
ncbi:hypothetical protein ScPMuIL_004457 [Solemya velum]